MNDLLPHDFFRRDPVLCARELVGCDLVWGKCRGRIIETEAYAAEGDAACHTFFRNSARKFVAAHDAGAAYVYLNYGMYWLANVLVKGGTRDGFVLLRALDPTGGLALMRKRRGVEPQAKLCSGPGKLTRALGIDGRHHGMDLCTDPGHGLVRGQSGGYVVADARVGISRATELPWRFLWADHPGVSRKVGRAGNPGK